MVLPSRMTITYCRFLKGFWMLSPKKMMFEELFLIWFKLYTMNICIETSYDIPLICQFLLLVTILILLMRPAKALWIPSDMSKFRDSDLRGFKLTGLCKSSNSDKHRSHNLSPGHGVLSELRTQGRGVQEQHICTTHKPLTQDIRREN
jgi:hypothetical protein